VTGIADQAGNGVSEQFLVAVRLVTLKHGETSRSSLRGSIAVVRFGP
jgi:hypothetical protein